MKRLSVLLYALCPVLLILLVWVSKSVGQEEKYPLAVSIKLRDGDDLPEMEDNLINTINGLGYPVMENAFILMEGIVSITSEKQIGGVSPKFMIDFKLDIQIKDSEQGSILESFSATGKGLGNTGKEAFQKGLQQIKIDTAKLSEILANCQDDYLRIQERRHLFSKERFEEGERLFQQKRYRESLAKLKLVYPETEFFSRAQRLIQDIRWIMPKPVIAVLTFKTNSSSTAENFRDILTTTLVQMEAEEVIVLERNQIEELLKEQKRELDGLVDPATASEFGRQMGAGFMLLGSLTVSGGEIEVDAKLVKVETGTIEIAFHTKATKEQLEMVAQNIVAEINKAIEAGKLDKPEDDKKLIVDANTPRVMIMIPEEHIHRQAPRRIPDPAGETEMIRKFVESGFRVVDQSQVKKIRDTKEGKAATKGDTQSAVAIARQYGAEVIIVGEAFSENLPRPTQELQTCSARVEARAIDADTDIIIAANGKEAHATDATEETAAKKALRTAGGLLADDMIKQITDRWKGVKQESK
jgi:TolB-like protein